MLERQDVQGFSGSAWLPPSILAGTGPGTFHICSALSVRRVPHFRAMMLAVRKTLGFDSICEFVWLLTLPHSRLRKPMQCSHQRGPFLARKGYRIRKIAKCQKKTPTVTCRGQVCSLRPFSNVCGQFPEKKKTVFL